MKENIHTKGEADFRQYEQVWQRVAPALNPWPVTVSGTSAAQNDAQNTPGIPDTQSGTQNTRNLPQTSQSSQDSAQSSQDSAQSSQDSAQNVQQAAEASLPGAERNPCCMGTQALTDTEVLTGFVEEELFLQREFQALSQQTPLWVRPFLRTFAGNALAHARRLTAVYYLITGEVYEPAVQPGSVFRPGNGFDGAMSAENAFAGGMPAGNCFDLLFGGNRFNGIESTGKWCAELRQRYHDTACTALNYIRAAEETTDPCLARVLDELGEQAYQQSSEILRVLERAIA